MGTIRTLAFLSLLLAASTGQAITYTVKDAGSAGDSNGNDDVCSSVSPPNANTCTLQAAIGQANAKTGTHIIKFAPDITKITLSASLIQVTAPVTFDGSNPTNVGSGGRVEIDGAGIAGCFVLTDVDTATHIDGAKGSTVKNFLIRRCSGDGISLSGHGYTITGNRIGTNAGADSGSSATDRNRAHGIFLSGTAPVPAAPPTLATTIATLPQTIAGVTALQATIKAALTVIASPNVIAGNVVSGNDGTGIWITGQGTVNTIISGNIVGLSADGLSAIPNGRGPGGSANRAGIRVSGTAYGNFIGPGNIVSGNLGDGISLDPLSVLLPNFVAGNLIGLGSAPTDVGNADHGIAIDTRPKTTGPGANNPTGIGAIIGPANTISDNKGTANSPDLDDQNDTSAGIIITGNSDRIRVFANVIGLATFPAGSTPVGQLNYGNAGNGMLIGTANNDIRNNIVLANGRHGILVRTSSAVNNVIRGNFIGVSVPTGLDPLIGLGNTGDGIHISNASSNVIGGPAPTDANVIAGNRRNGIGLRFGSQNSGWSNLITRNQIYGNARGGSGVGIDLERTQNASDPLDQLENPGLSYANHDQHRPAICGGALDPPNCPSASSPSSNGSATSLQWTMVGRPNSSMRLEFFANAADGAGQTYLGDTLVATDGAGLPTGGACDNGVCSASIGGGDSTGMGVVATATDLFLTDVPPTSDVPPVPPSPANNTSEFSDAAVAVRELEITTPAPLPGATTNVPYSVTFAATGGSGSYPSWILQSGALPTGLTLGIPSGTLSGTPTAAGTFPFSVRVTDSEGAIAIAAYSITVTAQPPLVITTPSPLPNATIGSAYALTFAAAGGTGAKDDWLVQSGALPDGLSLASASGVLDGTPAQVGDFAFNVRVSDQASTTVVKAFTLKVLPQPVPLAISTPSPLAATNVGTPVNREFVAVGGSGVYVSWVVSAGALPAGVALDSGAGTLSGTAMAAGAFDFSLKVTDDAGATATRAFSLLVNPAAIPPAGPIFTATPTEIDFGAVNVGGSAIANVLLTNLGTTSLDPNILAVSASTPEFTTDVGSCTGAMAPGSSCTMMVAFTPSAGGGAAFSGTSQICRGAALNGFCLLSLPPSPANQLARLRFRGKGAGTLAQVSPTTIDFGDVALGSTVNVIVSITNTSDGLLSFNPAAVLSNPVQFSRPSHSCGIGQLGSNGTCSYTFRFAPTILGAAESSSRISIGGAGTGETYDILLRGRGTQTAGASTTAPAALDFGLVGVGDTRTLAVVTTNLSGQAMLLTGSSLAGDAQTWASNVSDQTTFPVANAATFSSNYTFTPRAEGSYSLTPHLTLQGAAIDRQVPVALTGTGVGALVEASPVDLAYGLVLLGDSVSSRVTITNTSVDDLTRSFSGASPFGNSTNCPATIAAGATCRIDYFLNANDSATGAIATEATLHFANEGTGNSQTVTINLSAFVVTQIFRHGFE